MLAATVSAAWCAVDFGGALYLRAVCARLFLGLATFGGVAKALAIVAAHRSRLSTRRGRFGSDSIRRLPPAVRHGS